MDEAGRRRMERTLRKRNGKGKREGAADWSLRALLEPVAVGRSPEDSGETSVGERFGHSCRRVAQQGWQDGSSGLPERFGPLAMCTAREISSIASSHESQTIWDMC